MVGGAGDPLAGAAPGWGLTCSARRRSRSWPSSSRSSSSSRLQRHGRGSQRAQPPGTGQEPLGTLSSSSTATPPRPHSQVLRSHQLHQDAQGPHLGPQVLQHQPLPRTGAEPSMEGPLGLLPAAGTPRTAQGEAGRPLSWYPRARGRGVAQPGCGDGHHVEAVSICQREITSARCHTGHRWPRHCCGASCWHPPPTWVTSSALL